jgi:hypothetical protein
VLQGLGDAVIEPVCVVLFEPMGVTGSDIMLLEITKRKSTTLFAKLESVFFISDDSGCLIINPLLGLFILDPFFEIAWDSWIRFEKV